MLIDYTNQDKKLLFKFMPLNLFSLQTIVNNTLYFNKPNLLNDPLDCQFEMQIANLEFFSQKTVDFIKSKRHLLSQKFDDLSRNAMLTHNEELQKEFLNEFFKFDLNENYGVCSFSETVDHNLLWSHYGDRGKGICIVFIKDELLKSIDESLKDTYYTFKHDFVRYKGVKKLYFSLIKSNSGFSYTFKHFYSKTKHWSYEKEYRIVLIKKFKEWDQFSYPYDFQRIMPFSKESIHSIILGEKIDSQDKQLIENIVNYGNLNTPLKYCHFD